MTAKAKHLIISGRVQGVGYRAWLARTASALNIKGWVRNREDGTVEAMIAGDEPDMQTLIKKTHQGPIMAKVLQVDARETVYEGPGKFEVRPTA